MIKGVRKLENKKKRHHYLPETYLKGFTDSSSENLWVYLKDSPIVRKSTPRNEGCQKYYYAFYDVKGSRHTNTIEDFFSDIEHKFSNVLIKIHDCVKLSNQDRINLAVFIAFMQTRGPWFRSEIDRMAAEHINKVGLENAKKDFKSSLDTISKIIGIKPKIQDDDFLNLLSSRGSIFSLTQVFDSAYNFYKQLLEFKWRFLFSNTKLKYITSDNPIYYYSENDQNTIQGDRILNKNVEMTIPLSKKVALLAMRKKLQEGYGDANRISIKAINKRTVWGAKNNIYASFNEKTFLSFVQKHKNIRPYMVMVPNKMDR